MLAWRNINLKTFPDSSDDIFEIGAENCCLKFNYVVDQLVSDYQKYMKYKIRLITPRVSQKHVEETINYIKTALNKLNINEVIINDLGILYELRSQDIKANYILGRLLVRCQEYELNYCQRLIGEDKHVVDNWVIPNIIYSKKIKWLYELGFISVELCPSESIKKIINNKVDIGLKINIHYHNIVGAIGRTCVSAKINEIETKKCQIFCNENYEMKLASLYNKKDNQNEILTDEINDGIINGNAIYLPVKDSGLIYHAANDVIIDVRLDDSYKNGDNDFEKLREKYKTLIGGKYNV
jgi:hypothetical protein